VVKNCCIFNNKYKIKLAQNIDVCQWKFVLILEDMSAFSFCKKQIAYTLSHSLYTILQEMLILFLLSNPTNKCCVCLLGNKKDVLYSLKKILHTQSFELVSFIVWLVSREKWNNVPKRKWMHQKISTLDPLVQCAQIKTQLRCWKLYAIAI
jgi:hypothetical protein